MPPASLAVVSQHQGLMYSFPLEIGKDANRLSNNFERQLAEEANGQFVNTSESVQECAMCLSAAVGLDNSRPHNNTQI